MKLSKLLTDTLGRALRERGGDSVLSRRKLLLGGTAALAALTGSRKKAVAVPPGANNRFLVDRLTFGWTQEEQNLADSLGYHEYLEHHLDPDAIEDGWMTQRLSTYETLDYKPWLMNTLVNVSYGYEQLYEATILRAIYSKRQLYERMVEFWSDHFNIYMFSNECSWIKNWEDKNVIRPHALGTFREILSASMHSACMLHYLNNELSVVGNPNENYARELMELHTLGVDGGYTQQDVVEVARCLTGWGMYVNFSDGFDRQMFRYTPANHDNGQKVVLGHIIPAGGGITDGEQVTDILASHPSTARFVARKLCKRFWSENPPQALIDAVTATYLNTDGDIKSMLRTLFLTLDPSTADPKFKRPFHLFASAMRATGAQYNSNGQSVLLSVFNQLTSMGHLPFGWAPPDGYPDRVDYWANLPLPRWSLGSLLSINGINGLSLDVAPIFGSATTADQLADRINEMLFGGRMEPDERDLIRDYLVPNPASASLRQEAVGLALASPSFQYY